MDPRPESSQLRGRAVRPAPPPQPGGRKRFLALALIMGAVAMGAALIAIFVLYRTGFAEEQQRLTETAQSQARLMEAVARFDAQHSTTDVSGGSFAATISQIRDAHRQFRGSGETGEIFLVQRRGDQIHFLLDHRASGLRTPDPIPLMSPGAETFRRALGGESGAGVTEDIHGRSVLAAYEPVRVLNLGVVVQIDMAEIRAPFIRAGLLAANGTLLLIAVGLLVFRRIGSPLVANLESAERKYRTLFDAASDGVFVATATEVEYNEHARELLGVEDTQSLVGSPLAMAPARQPDGQESTSALQQRVDAAMDGQPQQFNWTLQRKDGQLVEAQVTLKSVSLDHGSAILGTIHDMTERKRADRALRRSEETLRLTLEATRDAVWDWDLETGKVRASPTAWTLRGYEPNEFEWTREKWLEHHHESDRARHAELFARLESGSLDAGELEVRTRKKDGSFGWSYIRSRVVTRDETGRPRRVVTSEQDITERQRVAAELSALEARLRRMRILESLGTMAGGIAHDFNNLLQGILGNAEIALMDLPRGHPASASILDIKEAGLRAAKLSGQMLDYAGRSAASRTPLDPSQIAARAVESALASLPNLTIELKAAPTLPKIVGDFDRLREILVNLLGNAAEADRGSGVRVTISMARVEMDRGQLASTYIDDDLPPGPYVRIRVRDNGVGMTPATLARVFDPFFTTKFAGRGLGMASVLGIVRAHNGAIRVDSEADVGTRVTLWFPAQEPAASLAIAPPQGADAQESATVTVLIVDDEEMLRELARRQLERLDVEVLTASNGMEAIAMLEQHRDAIDLVLLDLAMPIMRGDVAAVRLREIKPNLKIVLASGYDEEELGGAALAEYDGFLHKPYRFELLAQILREVLDHPRSRRALEVVNGEG